MSSKKVLVTGATGYVGFAVLIQTLKAGYQVRAAVRSIERAKTKLLGTPSLSSSSDLAARLTFIEVSDILTPGAYNEAIKDVDYVIHVASPISSPHIKDFQTELIDPARAGTLGILQAALSSTQVKRIVITSSVVANVTKDGNLIESNAQIRTADPKGPFADVSSAYRASKNIALNASEDFVKQHKPAWDIINIQPGFVVGPNELATTTDQFLDGTAAYAINTYVSEPRPRLTGFVHIDDVAFVHVASLDPKIKGERSYGVNQTIDWNESWSILEKEFPDAIKNGIFQKKDVSNLPFTWDASETEEVFGFKFKTFEQSVVESAKQWLSLAEK